MASLSRIGSGTVIRGNIRGAGDIDIEGRVEGSIEVTGEVMVAEPGRLRAGVHARRVVVRGAVAGDLRATEAIILEDSARVVGDLQAPSIGIRPGGLLRGQVTSGDHSESDLAKTTAKPKAVAQTRSAAPIYTQPLHRAVAPPVRMPAARPSQTASAQNHGATTQASGAVRQAPTFTPAVPVAPPPAEAVEAVAPKGPPPPVMPQLQRGARATMKKKSAR